MKSEFIFKFIKGIVNTGKEFYEIYNWTPIYYKGFQVSGPNRKKTYRGFKNLEHRGIIRETGTGKYGFTEKGKTWFKASLLKCYKDLGVKWDGKWRLVIFDIPQEFHSKRNQFRRRLRTLGFYKVQKSVFAFPYPCDEELSNYCHELNISDYINVIRAENLGSVTDEARKFFRI